MGNGDTVRRRQVGNSRPKAETNGANYQEAANRHHYKKNVVSGKSSRGSLFRFFSIFILCFSTFAVVFLVLNSRDNGQTWSQIQSQLHQHLGFFMTADDEPLDDTPSRRFPKLGTPEFAKQCSWVLYPPEMREPKCTLLARPKPYELEGISQWTADGVETFLLARLIGCDFFMDYGPGVDVHQVLTPIQKRRVGFRGQPLNWTVPSDLECEWKPPEKNCIQTISHPGGPSPVPSMMNLSLPELPKYRFVYERPSRYMNKSDYFDIEQAIPGFRVETGMACALGSLFDLSPRASQFEPELFTKIIPAVHDEKALTIAIYVRTGLTDVEARKEKGHKVGDESKNHYQSDFTVRCALKLEQQFLRQNTSDGPAYSRVVWTVLTDSQGVKQWITEKYSGQEVTSLSKNKRVMRGLRKEAAKTEDGPIPPGVTREVLSTKARGVHTRNSRKPSTLDFAEAVIDWYLIGESDVVIGSGPSFGATGSLRTARPYYNLHTCELHLTVH